MNSLVRRAIFSAALLSALWFVAAPLAGQVESARMRIDGMT